MKFFKNNLKLIIGFIIGVIIASGITVYAYSYFASDVGYTKPETTTATSVETALNELYELSGKCKIYEFNLNIDQDITTNDAYYYFTKSDKENLLVIYAKFTINTTYDGQNIITINNLPNKNYTQIYKNISGTENPSIRSDSISNGTFSTTIDANYGGYKNAGNSTWFRFIYTFE